MNQKVYQNMEVVGSVTANKLDITGGGSLGDGLKELIKDYVDSIRYDANDECYYFSDKPTSPAIRYGGTWERVKDRFIMGASDTYAAGSTGGETSHLHDAESMYAQITTYNDDLDLTLKSVRWESDYITPNVVPNTARNKRANADAVGIGGQTNTVSNIPPYRAAYIWRRISN